MGYYIFLNGLSYWVIDGRDFFISGRPLLDEIQIGIRCASMVISLLLKKYVLICSKY